jgi:MFS transporter, ACS family, D-galactonate transporter
MPTSTLPHLKTRWQIPAVLAVTVFINYLDRNNLALAIPRLAQDFGWSDREVGAKGELLFSASCPLTGLVQAPDSTTVYPSL